MRNLRWRIGAIVAVIAISIWGFYPPGQKINLGLDLKGGVHLVLRVRGEQALRVVSETTMEQLRDQLTRNNVNDFGPLWVPGGSRVAFTRLTGGANDVWTIRADGIAPRRQTTAAAQQSPSHWGAGP